MIKEKVYGYVTFGFQLLLFEHVDFPEAGIQVPGGTVESREDFSSAVLREVTEETGLEDLHLVRFLGSVRKDLRDFGLAETHQRYYFHLGVNQFPGETWIAFEETPSDGSEGPINFRFFWAPLNSIPPLMGGLDEMLPLLRAGLNA